MGCESLLRPTNDDRTVGFKLGQPFFRNFTVSLDFETEYITIESKPVNSPLSISNIFPSYDTNKQMIINQTFMSTGQYYGSALVGLPSQGDGQQFCYSTASFYSNVPSSNANVPEGWFDESSSITYTQIGETEEISAIFLWAGTCMISQDMICINPDDSDDCVYDQYFCLVEDEIYPTSYDFTGTVGFGKPETEDYESTMGTLMGEYWRQMSYAPLATFDYNFEGQSSNVYIGVYANADNLIKNTTSYSMSSQWALHSNSTVWDGVTYNTTSDKPYAVIASAYPFVAVPSDVFTAVTATL